jgi:hypothetical protein
MKRARAATGVAIAALYVVVALISFDGGLFPVRPLYDGTTPPPAYRWVKPPAELAAGNQLPTDGKASVVLTSKGAEAGNVTTDDGQAQVVYPPNGIVPMAGETKVNTTIEPIDPATVGAPPAGFDYDGNAYRFTGVYAKSGKPAQIPPEQKCSLTEPNACATIVLRYAFNATALYRRDGSTWVEVPTQNAGAALQIYGASDKLGVFVAVDAHLPGGPKKKSQTGNIIAFVLGFIAIIAGTFLARIRAVRRRKRSRQGRAARAKGGRKQ